MKDTTHMKCIGGLHQRATALDQAEPQAGSGNEGKTRPRDLGLRQQIINL